MGEIIGEIAKRGDNFLFFLKKKWFQNINIQLAILLKNAISGTAVHVGFYSISGYIKNQPGRSTSYEYVAVAKFIFKIKIDESGTQPPVQLSTLTVRLGTESSRAVQHR
eukprot:SAG31_NODE_132_length_23398_cov_14.557620_12_plen_109_part_00